MSENVPCVRVVCIDIGGGKGTGRGSLAGTQQTRTADTIGGGVLEGGVRTQVGVLHELVPYVRASAGLVGHGTANAPAARAAPYLVNGVGGALDLHRRRRGGWTLR